MLDATGSTGPIGPTFIRQLVANINISGDQTIASNGAVTYITQGSAINGVLYNNLDTFTVITLGVYVLQCVLNFLYSGV